MTAYGINPQGGGMNPCDEELGETCAVCHMGGVLITGMRLSYPLDCCGTLCARDGIKTGRRTPSGQDAWQKKLVVHTRSASRQSCREKGGF